MKELSSSGEARSHVQRVVGPPAGVILVRGAADRTRELPMRPDPFNEYQARVGREREAAKRREVSEDAIRRQMDSGGLDVGMVVMAIIVLAALLVFFLSITPS
jgi:hypothetical protein